MSLGWLEDLLRLCCPSSSSSWPHSLWFSGSSLLLFLCISVQLFFPARGWLRWRDRKFTLKSSKKPTIKASSKGLLWRGSIINWYTNFCQSALRPLLILLCLLGSSISAQTSKKLSAACSKANWIVFGTDETPSQVYAKHGKRIINPTYFDFLVIFIASMLPQCMFIDVDFSELYDVQPLVGGMCSFEAPMARTSERRKFVLKSGDVQPEILNYLLVRTRPIPRLVSSS